MFIVEEFRHLKLQLQDIILATENFDPNKLIGNGGFGKVYKGELFVSGRSCMVAFKRLDSKFGQGNTEFWKEIIMLSKYKHENLVSLLHFCFEGDERILVYEYASRGSLDRYLSDASLTWIQRLKICIGVARGLSYLHDPMETKQRVLHRDVKSSNILLDEEWNAKVSDFGLSKVGPANQPQTYLVSNVVGTFGYCDPSYFETGILSKESDVYSFGVVLFEVLCGRLCCEYDNGEMIRILVPTWKKCFEEDRLGDIIMQALKEQIHHDSLMTFSKVANRCLQRDHKKRPTMAEIVRELEVAIERQGSIIQQHGINRNEEGDEIMHTADKLQLASSEPATESRNLSSVKSDELDNIGSKGTPMLLLDTSEDNCWWAFDQGLTSGRRLPVFSSGESFIVGHKESFCFGTHLLVSRSETESIVIWRYELATNRWYRGPSMLNPRSLFASAACGSSGLVAGGTATFGGGNGFPIVLNTVEKYDVETRSWTPLPRMKKPRQLCSGCYMDDKFYIIGGKNNDEGELTCGEYFDPERNQWTLVPGMLKDNPVLSGHPPPLIAVVNNELYSIDTLSNELKVYLKNTNGWKSLGLVPVRADYLNGWCVAFKSFGNELLVIGPTAFPLSSNSRAIYTCSPVEPQSGRLPDWKLRDFGNIQLDGFIYDCCVMCD